jgi:hypothetical protein
LPGELGAALDGVFLLKVVNRGLLPNRYVIGAD